MYRHIAQVMQQVLLFATDTEDVHVELVAESHLLHRAVHQPRRRHEHDFSDTYVVEIERVVSRARLFGHVLVHHADCQVGSQSLHIVECTFHIENVARLQYHVGRGKLLRDGLQELVFRHVAAPYFQYVDGILRPHVEFHHRLADGGRTALHLQAEQVVREAVLIDQLLQRLPGTTRRFLPPFREEQLA